ncbi:MAG: hypothetical protein KDF67_08365, partial [Ottowia sp.]|nr:hypothetical protein [Ottowia sp.]
AKGASQVLRMSYSRKRRYGRNHLEARLGQIDALISRIRDYAAEFVTQQAALDHYAAGSLWMDAGFARRATQGLANGSAGVDALLRRAEAARAGFEALPRLDEAGPVPAPVAHAPLDA